MNSGVIELSEVYKSFGQVEALKGISFEVRRGEVFSLIGPNGAGKTTTILTVLGYHEPDKGNVKVFGKDPSKEYTQMGEKTGIMIEKQGLFERLTGFEYLDLFAEVYGLQVEIKTKRIKDLLEIVRLSSRANDLIRTYSQGMKQRLCLARCLINKPELLVLDEPFSNIDPEGRRSLIEILSKIVQETKSSVLLTSHDLREVERISDRIAILNKGKIIKIGSSASLEFEGKTDVSIVIRLKPGNNEAVISRLFPNSNYDAEKKELRVNISNDEDRNRIIRLLIDNKITILSIYDDISTLEQAYFSLLGEEDLK